MVKPFRVKPFLVTAFLVTAVGTFLAVGATAALAEEKKFLEIEPLSSDELFAEKGEGLDGGVQATGDDPLRRRRPGVATVVASGRSTVNLNSRRNDQINSTSLSAVNDLVNISNIAGGAGGGG